MDDPITLRRQMDDSLRSQMESDRQRINVISERLNRVEVVLENISERFDDHEEAAADIQNKLTGIAEKMTVLSTHFSDHIMREEDQRKCIKDMANILQVITQDVKVHEHRINTADRLLWALGGCVLSGFGAFIAWGISHLESLPK
jgi:chromosome segregation ATPase